VERSPEHIVQSLSARRLDHAVEHRLGGWKIAPNHVSRSSTYLDMKRRSVIADRIRKMSCAGVSLCRRFPVAHSSSSSAECDVRFDRDACVVGSASHLVCCSEDVTRQRPSSLEIQRSAISNQSSTNGFARCLGATDRLDELKQDSTYGITIAQRSYRITGALDRRPISRETSVVANSRIDEA